MCNKNIVHWYSIVQKCSTPGDGVTKLIINILACVSTLEVLVRVLSFHLRVMSDKMIHGGALKGEEENMSDNRVQLSPRGVESRCDVNLPQDLRSHGD
jgi:hypothetical protein